MLMFLVAETQVLFSDVMIPLRLYSLLVSGAVMAAGAYYLFRGKRKSTDDIERERRDMLGQIGRITDGTVIDVQEISEDLPRPATMLIYHYDVAGVSYEASQDVTYLRQWINLQSCRLGYHLKTGHTLSHQNRPTGPHSGLHDVVPCRPRFRQVLLRLNVALRGSIIHDGKPPIDPSGNSQNTYSPRASLALRRTRSFCPQSG